MKSTKSKKAKILGQKILQIIVMVIVMAILATSLLYLYAHTYHLGMEVKKTAVVRWPKLKYDFLFQAIEAGGVLREASYAVIQKAKKDVDLEKDYVRYIIYKKKKQLYSINKKAFNLFVLYSIFATILSIIIIISYISVVKNIKTS